MQPALRPARWRICLSDEPKSHPFWPATGCYRRIDSTSHSRERAAGTTESRPRPASELVAGENFFDWVLLALQPQHPYQRYLQLGSFDLIVGARHVRWKIRSRFALCSAK